MSVPIIYHDGVAPETFGITVPTGTSGLDMTTVTAAVFNVVRADGSTTTWTCALVGATTSQVSLVYTRVALDTYVSGVRVSGPYQLYASLTVGGTERSLPFGILVLSPTSVQQ